jgi:hypothetical protein
MRYSLTPLNCFCALLIGLEIVFFAFPESLKNETYGYQHVFLIPVILVGILIDFILQKIIAKYAWLVFVESILVVTAILLNLD